jgi:hypothetical protein
MARENPESTQGQPPAAVVQHVVEAHNLLKQLSERLEKHPELEQAIEKLELALNDLTLRTGGML